MNILNHSTKKIVLAGTHIEPGKTGSISKELVEGLMTDFTVKNMFRDGLLVLIPESETVNKKDKTVLKKAKHA